MPKEQFSLKDHLFNAQKIHKIALEIHAVYSEFRTTEFEKQVVSRFPELELMERLYWVRECLRKYLPDEYRTAVQILLKSLPPPTNPSLSDDDFGDFIYGPYGNFVAEYGATKKDVLLSLQALRQMTTRFSVEFPIRVFLNTFPEETLSAFEEWVTDAHYHVRRLVSEGSRPNLPWAKKITLDYRIPVQFLDILHADNTRFVTRSVANHLNDIAKKDPDLVLNTLKKWKKASPQTDAELDFITRHSLRTLVKDGHKGALAMLGYEAVDIQVSKLTIHTAQVAVGESLEYSFTVTSVSPSVQKLLIDYVVYFKKASGELTPKTYKLSKLDIQPGEKIVLSKKHPLRLMTTRKLYPGTHEIEVQINGETFGRQAFDLIQ